MTNPTRPTTDQLIAFAKREAQEQGLYVRCPICNVGTGRRCIGNGRQSHAERIALAK